MDSDSPQPGFHVKGIDPVLYSRDDPDTSGRSHNFPHLQEAPRQAPWAPGSMDGDWEIATEDYFEDWAKYAILTGPEFQQNIPSNGIIPGTGDDGQGQLSESWREIAHSSNNSIEPQSSPGFQNQTCTKLGDSSQPFQPALQLYLEGHPLDSSKALSNTSSDTGSTIRTPSSSDGETIHAVTGSQHNDQKATSALSSRKRRLDAMKPLTLVFPIREDQPPIKRTRKSYPPSRRKEVAMIRQMGACARCRFQKVASTFPRPCYQCVKSGGSPSVARAICIRQTFFEVRFGGFDILFESFTKDFLCNEIGKYNGPERKVRLGLTYDRYSPTLEVTVRDYFPPGSADPVLYNVIAVDEKTFKNIQSERYAIVPQSMPTLADILCWVKMTIPAIDGNPVQRLTIALKDFMSQYCEHRPILPMHDLLAGSVTILKLVHCWRSNMMVVPGNGEFDGLLVSKATSRQILMIVKEGIREAESVILKALEKPMYGASGPGQKNMIPLWACLWSLLLTYRDCMVVYKQFQPAKRLNTRQPGCSDHERLIDASKHMYDILTANYSALFRDSSPLHLDWRIGSNFEYIGKSPILKAAFYELRNEVFRFYETTDQLFAEDSLLREMIIDQERTLTPG